MAGFRSVLSTTRGVPRLVAALLSQRGSARIVSGLLSEAGLAISGNDAAKFKTTTTARVASSTHAIVTKAAIDNLTFSDAHTITAGAFGVILVQLQTSNGAISTKVPNATQAYADASEAQQHCPAPDAGKVALGRFIIKADRVEIVEDEPVVQDFVANTDDLDAVTLAIHEPLG